MRKLLIALASVGAVLGAGAASAQTYHDNWDQRDHGGDRGYNDRSYNDRGYHGRYDRGYHDRGYRDHGWRSSWWGHRRYDHGRYAYGRQVCDWRDGERVCWYQR